MYGLLLESVMHFGQCEYGEEMWDRVLEHAGCKTTVFSTHLQYDDNILLGLASSCAAVLGKGDKEDHLMFFGRCFVRFFSNYGYDKLICVTGRHFCEFLSEVDNLHSQMRVSFPRMRSPSMVLRSVDADGACLQYRSNRFGFTHYLVGQLLQIARDLYNMTLLVSVKQEVVKDNTVSVTFRLDFDNREFLQDQIAKRTEIQRAELPQITLQKLLQFFPFGIIIDMDMRIVLVGEQLMLMVGKQLIGSKLIDHFIVQKPFIESLTWDTLLAYQRVTWELESKVVPEANGISGSTTSSTSSSSTSSSSSSGSNNNSKPQSNSPAHRLNRVELLRRGSSQAVWAMENDLPAFRALILKGQIYFLTECNLALFLCMPLINQLKEMREMGLYLNDLSMHDQSRELALREFQHCSRLQIMYTRAEEYSGKLEDSLNLQEEWKAKGDDLLYSMLPRQVADLLRQGNDPLDTCRTFAEVSVMFAEATITNEGDISHALDVVRSVNDMYSLLDNITDQYSVFKVETVGGVYMVVGGAPIYRHDHVAEVAALALHMVRAVTSEVPRAYNIRIGIHVGPVVAGVVGLKLPRYCLFGDTVNTAARMQTNSLKDRVHISEMCARQLERFDFITTHRGKLDIKGKGQMDTFWLDGRK